MVLGLEHEANTSCFNSWIAICMSALTWTLSYKLFLRTFTEKSPEFSCRIVAFLHGFIAASLGIKECFINGSPYAHPEWSTTSLQSFLLALSLGYFIFDLSWCIFYQTETQLMICHHIYSVIALYRLLGRAHNGAESVCGLATMELTNPLLQARWFIRTLGFYPSLLFDVVELVFFVLFTVVRILWGTYNIYTVLTHAGNDWEITILCFVIYILSVMFLISIVKYIFFKYVYRFKNVQPSINDGVKDNRENPE